MEKLYFEDSTREELIECECFKFKDSPVCFKWDDSHSVLYIDDLDDGSIDHLCEGDFSVLPKLGIDVEALNEKLEGIELHDWVDNHYTVLGEL